MSFLTPGEGGAALAVGAGESPAGVEETFASTGAGGSASERPGLEGGGTSRLGSGGGGRSSGGGRPPASNTGGGSEATSRTGGSRPGGGAGISSWALEIAVTSDMAHAEVRFYVMVTMVEEIAFVQLKEITLVLWSDVGLLRPNIPARRIQHTTNSQERLHRRPEFNISD